MRRAGAILFGIVAICAGCGGGDDSAEDVTHYIEDVNAVQRELALPLAAVGRANRELRSGGKLGEIRPKLEKSAATILRLERRLDAIEPPAEARRLHAIVHQIVESEWELAHEFALLARYVPAARPALARASAAGVQVRVALKATTKPEAQADALDSYAEELTSVARSLARLEPPPVVLAEHQTQIRSFRAIAASARSLGKALRDGKGQAEELRSLETALASGSSLRAQRARRAGVVEFNERIVRVRKLAAKAQRERTRLERALRS